MIDINILEKRRTEYAEELHAGSVFRDIQAREKERPIYEQRWLWELLQNAKDSVSIDDEVNVRIELSDTEVCFLHTGNPFKVDEILSLIIQGSSKTDDDNKTGRFGTGFMTTYLLSKKVEISGQLENDGGYFRFDLNRDVHQSEGGNAIKEFFTLQKESNDEFIRSIRETSYINEGRFQTRFRYSLDEKGKSTSKKGLKSLNELIPFTQIFNHQVGSVTVVQDGQSTTYEKRNLSKYLIGDNDVEEWELKSSLSDDVLKAYLLRHEDFDVVCVTEMKADVEYLKNLNSKYSKLFFTFPLIGTEEIGIPFIINSTKFDPKVERDGIYLNSTESENVGAQKNKELISRSLIGAITIFPEIIKKNNIQSQFNILKFSKSKGFSWIDEEWFTELKNRIIDEITIKKFIHLNNADYCYNELYIPYSSEEGLLESIWRLVSESKQFKTIPYHEQKNWILIAKDFASLKNKDVFDETSIIGSKKLCDYVEKQASLKNLNEDLEVNVYDWLDRLYQLINYDLDEFSLKKRILLNQEDDFVEGGALSWDEIKDDTLISISNKIGLDFSKRLISNNIKGFEIVGVDSYVKDQAVEDLKNKLNQIKESDYDSEDKLEANCTFLKWLINNSKNDLIKELKILSLDKQEDSNVISRIFPSERHLILPPKEFFKNKFPKYSEIIRNKDCMHPVYMNFLAKSEYEYLDRCGFIHYSPLVKRKEKLHPTIIKLLVQNIDELAEFMDNEGKIIEEIEFEYSDFAYLTTSEGYIYDRNSTTSSSLRIFDFLLNEATEVDDFFENQSEIVSLGDKNIAFDRTLWLKRAKSIQWVNVKNTENEGANKFSKEVPSSKNLSALIKDDDELIKTIRGEKQISFLSKIGVGVSDLIRNTLKSDEIRISWDKALTTMITSGVNPELAQEIFGDPMIQAEYQKRLNDKKLITRNQELGALVEKLFNDLILKLKEKGINVNICRKPFGSDYLLTDDSSDLVNDMNIEEVFGINDWLIELKATGKEYAAMTYLQAETAHQKRNNFALVIIPLDGSHLDIDYIRDNAKVISNIGYKISHTIDRFNDIESQKNKLIAKDNGVYVNIEDHNVRFHIDSSVWNSKDIVSISKFIEEQFVK